MLTHAAVGERREWKTFTEASNIPFTFYHRDEFEKLYTQVFTYPVILKKEGDILSTLLNVEVISGFKNTEELISGIKEKLRLIYE